MQKSQRSTVIVDLLDSESDSEQEHAKTEMRANTEPRFLLTSDTDTEMFSDSDTSVESTVRQSNPLIIKRLLLKEC
jgi:hypothetical protein